TDAAALAERAVAVDALAVGPGLGTDARAEAALAAVLDAGPQPMVLDADALTLLGSGRPLALSAVAGARPVLVTPHPGEMVRIARFGRDEIAADRVEVARAAALDLGCVVLLKGQPSVVAAPDHPVLID